MVPLIFAGSGHRPSKTGGYSPYAANLLARVAEAAMTVVRPDYVISGMALGWDTAIVEAAIMLHIPFIAAIPSKHQTLKWPEESVRTYNVLLEQAFQVVPIYTTDEYTPEQMQIRNEWMFDNSTGSLILWNGSSGGTGNYVKYAVAQASKPMYNVWPLLAAVHEVAQGRRSSESINLERLVVRMH